MKKEHEKYCKTCSHFLPAEHIGMVCMNVRSSRFGKSVKSMEGCMVHSYDPKKPGGRKMSD